MNELIKKLCLYSLNCIKSTQKNNSFLNVLKDKENKIYITNEFIFNNDDKKIVDLMTLSTLNKNTKTLIYGYKYFIKNDKNIYTPLLFTDSIEIKRNNDNIELYVDFDTLQININLISSLLDNHEDLIENIINQILNIEDLQNVDLKAVLQGLVSDKLKDYSIINENAIILCKIPEDNAGLIKELKELIKNY